MPLPRLPIRLLLVIPVLAVPFAYGEGLTRHHTALKDFAALGAATVLGIAGLAAWRPRRTGEVGLDPAGIYAPVLALVAWASLTLFWHGHPWSAAEPLVVWTIFAAGSLGLSILLRAEDLRRTLLFSYGAVLAASALVYFKVYHGAAWGPGQHFPFGNPNVGASFLLGPAVMAAVLVVDFRTRRRGPPAAFSALVLVALGLAIVRSESKGAWIGFGAGTFAGIALVVGSRGRRILLPAGALLVAAALVALAASPARRNDLAYSADVRLQMWRGTWSMIESAPTRVLAGHGIGSFLPTYPRFEPMSAELEGQWAQVQDDPHDIVLRLWAETGIAGALLLGVLAAAVIAAVRRGRRARTEPGDRAVLAAAGAGLLAMFVHGLLDISLSVPYVLWQASIGLALVSALGRPADSGARPGPPLRGRVARLLAGVCWSAGAALAALWGLSALPALRSELAHHDAFVHLEAARTAAEKPDRILAREEAAAAIRDCERALEIAPWEGFHTIRLRLLQSDALLFSARLAATASERIDLCEEAYQVLDRVAGAERGLMPDWGMGDYYLAQAAIGTQQPRLAAEHLRRGWTRRPAQWRYYWYWLVERDQLAPYALAPDLVRNLQRARALDAESFPLEATYALVLAAEGFGEPGPALARAEALGDAIVLPRLDEETRAAYADLLKRVKRARAAGASR